MYLKSSKASMMSFNKLSGIPEQPAEADKSAVGAIMQFNYLTGISEHLAKADKSAVGTVNRPLRMAEVICQCA
jgi:hypothetical protein